MTADPITREDLEAELRSVAGATGSPERPVQSRAKAIGILLGVVVLAVAFLAGRRMGEQRSTVVEVHRI